MKCLNFGKYQILTVSENLSPFSLYDTILWLDNDFHSITYLFFKHSVEYVWNSIPNFPLV